MKSSSQHEQSSSNQEKDPKVGCRDSFITDTIELICLIYKLAKLQKIPVTDFEKIITRSYSKTMNLKATDELLDLEMLVRQAYKKVPTDYELSAKIQQQFGTTF